jgi:hypothetical protein
VQRDEFLPWRAVTFEIGPDAKCGYARIKRAPKDAAREAKS